jgi:hypothetical protein
MTMHTVPSPARRRLLMAKLVLLALASMLAAALGNAQTAPGTATVRAPAGSRADSMIVYRREVFRYQPLGRPDPFRSLLGSAELGVRVEDLALRGVVYHPDPARSVAMLTREGVDRPIRARVGDRIGGIRILTIRPNSIDVLVEELGVARRETLQITRAARTAPGAAPTVAPPPAPTAAPRGTNP